MISIHWIKKKKNPPPCPSPAMTRTHTRTPFFNEHHPTPKLSTEVINMFKWLTMCMRVYNCMLVYSAYPTRLYIFYRNSSHIHSLMNEFSNFFIEYRARHNKFKLFCICIILYIRFYFCTFVK